MGVEAPLRREAPHAASCPARRESGLEARRACAALWSVLRDAGLVCPQDEAASAHAGLVQPGTRGPTAERMCRTSS